MSQFVVKKRLSNALCPTEGIVRLEKIPELGLNPQMKFLVPVLESFCRVFCKGQIKGTIRPYTSKNVRPWGWKVYCRMNYFSKCVIFGVYALG